MPTSFAELLNRFRGLRALVVGDVMLDEYIFGRATRISQEAPVMVVRQSSFRSVPGGAANVAGNLVALGARVQVVGVVGQDAAADTLAASFLSAGLQADGLVRDPSRPTTRKTRILANHAHQVLRIDHEDDTPVSGSVESEVFERARTAMAQADVLLVSDYQKGSVTGTVIEALVAEGRRLGVPVVANPKPKSLRFYRGASLVSLNRFEAADASEMKEANLSNAAEIAESLRSQLGVDRVLITLGADGMAAAGESACYVPAVRLDVYDEAGAGDTVIATVALGVGAGAFGRELLELAAQTAAAVVRRVGVAVPSREDLEGIRERQEATGDGH